LDAVMVAVVVVEVVIVMLANVCDRYVIRWAARVGGGEAYWGMLFQALQDEIDREQAGRG
jgi:hypothetical protein